MDVEYTRDGVPVLCHDPDAARVFGVSRRIADMTETEFLALRHVGRVEYPSHRLRDALDADIRPLLLHIKQSGDCLTATLDVLRAGQCLSDTVVGVLRAADVRYVKQREPSLRVLGFMEQPDEADEFLDAGADIIRYWESWMTPARIRHVHEKGRAVWIMAGGMQEKSCGYIDATSLLRIRAYGADGVLVNDVRFARRALCATESDSTMKRGGI